MSCPSAAPRTAHRPPQRDCASVTVTVTVTVTEHEGFAPRELRRYVAPSLGFTPAEFSQGRMTYDLRRLRLHGLIQRVPHSQRYRVTDAGHREAVFLHRAHVRLLGPGLAAAADQELPAPPRLRKAIEHVDATVAALWRTGALAA